jgi:hypothetical protein
MFTWRLSLAFLPQGEILLPSCPGSEALRPSEAVDQEDQHLPEGFCHHSDQRKFTLVSNLFLSLSVYDMKRFSVGLAHISIYHKYLPFNAHFIERFGCDLLNNQKVSFLV